MFKLALHLINNMLNPVVPEPENNEQVHASFFRGRGDPTLRKAAEIEL